MSPRNSREMRTIAECFDALLAGDLPQLGDLLVQRLKALQLATVEGNRSLAQHMELVQEIDVDQRNARCAAHANGAAQAQSSREGRCDEDSWCNLLGDSAREEAVSPAGHSSFRCQARNPSEIWAQRSMAPITQVQQRQNLAKSFLPEKARPTTPPAKTIPLQQPAFRRGPSPSPVANRAVSQERQPVLPGTRPLVLARRGALRPPSADEASSKRVNWNGQDADPPSTSRDCDSGKNESKGRRGTSSVEFSLREVRYATGNDAVFCVVPWALVHGQHNLEAVKSLLSTAACTAVGGKMVSGVAAIAVPSRYSALQNRSSLQHQKAVFTPWLSSSFRGPTRSRRL